MKAAVQAFWLPKAGNALAEYEDAYFPSTMLLDAVGSFRLAVADGATETSFAESWARLLAKAYCRGRLCAESLRGDISRLERVWKRHVGKKPLPWYAEQKLEFGAFAAVVGVEINAEAHTWAAFAVGDCCVFQVRGEALLHSFPLEKAEQFDNRPLLLSSVARNNNAAISSVKNVCGTWESGDTFYLMSDALAAWFLRYASLPLGDAANCLATLTSQTEFASHVEVQRKDIFTDGEPTLRNDDVTLLRCTLT